MEKLKCCPKCGNKEITTDIIMPTGNTSICCKRCGYTTKIFNTEDEAVEAWNQIKPQITKARQLHTIVSYANISLRTVQTSCSAKASILKTTQEKLMDNLSKVLLSASSEGKHVLIHPLEYRQHENYKTEKLEVERKLSYEIIEDDPILEEKE